MENELMKDLMQQLETAVRKSWQTCLLQLTQNDADFVQRFFPVSIPSTTTNTTPATVSAADLLSLEDRLRGLPPRSDLGAHVRQWFEEVLAQKSQMLLAGTRERMKSISQFRLQLVPLHDQIVHAMNVVFQKYKPIELGALTTPTATDLQNLIQQIQQFLTQQQTLLADISSKWIVPQRAPALLKFVMLMKDELLHWVPDAAPTTSVLPSPSPPVPVEKKLAAASPSEYMQVLQQQQLRREQVYRERQQQVNQLRDATQKQNREKQDLFRRWANEAPFPAWISHLEKILAQESDCQIVEWQNTTLRQRKIAADLQTILVHAEKQIHGILAPICHTLQQFLQRIEQQFVQNTRQTVNQIQTILRGAVTGTASETELVELREWMSIREQIFQQRYLATASRLLASVPVSLLAPPKIESQTVPL